MKIANYNVALASSHTLQTQSSATENLTMWTGDPPPTTGEPAFTVETGKQKPRFTPYTPPAAKATDTDADSETDAIKNVKLRLIEDLLYFATGKRVHLRDIADPLKSRISNAPNVSAQAIQTVPTRLPQAVQTVPARQGWGISYDSTVIRSEQEKTVFSASGNVQTADGRSISFNLDLAMERSYYEQSSVSLRLGDAARTVDPLAINLGNTAPSLTTQKFAFDLDSDGKAEQISFLSGQGGFLALDKNGDGKINDGSELFGTKSGDGFYDLAAYDDDGNGWIDENDSVFSKLKVFNMNADGTASLVNLGAAGVGALYLGNVQTDYAFKEGADTQGQMRKSSVFLREDGTAGTLHHIDLAV